MAKKPAKKTAKKSASKKTAKKTAKKSAKKSTKKQSSGWFGTLFAFAVKWGIVTGLWLLIILTGTIIWFASELPNITKAMVFERRPSIIIKDSSGVIVDRYGDTKGKIVDVKDLPPHVVNAVLAIEDRRFYDHIGMDPIGIARAFVVNIKRGGFSQGGSTITQQLAKNLFLSRERKIKRKIQELILAFQLEYELTKDEILSAYLNRVYLGAGAYGIDAAANIYFNKSATELSIREAATIAGLLKAPSRYAPSNNPELSAQRTDVVLQAMVNGGYIEQAEIDKMKNMPPSPRKKPSSGSTVRYFTDYVVSQLDDLIGTIDQDIIVETTLNTDVQNEMEESLTKALLKYGESSNVSEGAGVIMRLDGAVVGMLGGKNYATSEFNRATDSLRPPGSSFKPFVYLTAIEKGWNVDSIIEDAKITRGRYKPQNFGHRYYGPVTLYRALTLSLNTVSVNLMRDVGPGEVIGMARRLGITADLEPDLSLALGSSGVPMIQMATAYTTLGRAGSAVDPYSIRKITNKEGTVLYQYSAPTEKRQVVSQKDVGAITYMMRSVVENGTGKAAQLPYPTAGKTGTSQDYRDAWFAGFTTKYAGVIWMGNDDNSSTNKLTGGSAPARIWKEVMLKAQSKGGRSYPAFSSYVPRYNLFDDLLGDILADDEFEYGRRPEKERSGFGWFSSRPREQDVPRDNNDGQKFLIEEDKNKPDRHRLKVND